MDKSQRDVKGQEKQQSGTASHANEGEGSRSAARDYNQRTEKFIKSGKVDESAKQAEKAVEGQEGKELAEAEKIGRSHAKH
ncbi:MAG: hypothetical protein ACM30I_00635 [Gemmatimonas sp.]